MSIDEIAKDQNDETKKFYKARCSGFKSETKLVPSHIYLTGTPPVKDPETGLESHSTCENCQKLYMDSYGIGGAD